MNKSQIISQALEYLRDYKAKLEEREAADNLFPPDLYYLSNLDRIIYFLTQIYYQLKGE